MDVSGHIRRFFDAKRAENVVRMGGRGGALLGKSLARQAPTLFRTRSRLVSNARYDLANQVSVPILQAFSAI